MDLTFSETDRMLSDAARSLLGDKFGPATLQRLEQSATGFDDALWKEFVATGWTELASGDLHGESLGLLAVLLREMGRAALASPFFQSVVAAGVTLQKLGDTELAKKLLAQIAAGSKAVLVTPSDPAGVATGQVHPDGITIAGGPFIIEWAHLAEHLVCTVQTGSDDYVLVALKPGHPGLVVRELRSIDNERIAQVSFDKLVVQRGALLTTASFNQTALENCLLLVRVLRATEMAGGVERVLEMTVEYVMNRKQFGRPLGALQAVQHLCADIAMESDAAFLSTCEAISLAAEPQAFPPRAALASFITGRAYERVTQASAELHGGMGAMSEYPLQYYFRRAKGQRQRLGSIRYQLESVARHVVDATAKTGKFPTRESLVAD